MKNKYISAFAIAVSFGLLVGCSNKTDDVISDNVQTQAVESSESVVETVETASQNETAETAESAESAETAETAETAESAESTTTTESVEVSKEDESLIEVVSNQNEVVQEQTTVEEAVPTEQTTQPAQQSKPKSTSTSLRDYNIDMDHMHWCEENDPSQLTEDEATYLMNRYSGFPKDPRQMTVAEFDAYMKAYFSNQFDTYSDANTTSTTPTEDREYTQEELNAIAAANGITTATHYDDASELDGYEIVWD